MSAAERAAVTQEVLDQAHLWRTMAAQKHGVPQYPQPRNTVGKWTEPEPISIPFPQSVTINNAAAKGMGWVTKTAIGAAMLGGTIGTGAGAIVLGKSIYDAMSGSGAAATPPAVSDASDPATGDLLQWLRENGYHLPPGGTDG